LYGKEFVKTHLFNYQQRDPQKLWGGKKITAEMNFGRAGVSPTVGFMFCCWPIKTGKTISSGSDSKGMGFILAERLRMKRSFLETRLSGV